MHSVRHYETLKACKIFRKLQKEIKPNKNIKILDLGCGTGVITSILKDKGYSVVGADISSVAIDKLNEKGINGFIQDVKNPIKSEDNKFDVVFATDLLELVPDVYLFLSEVRRVVKNDGLFVYSMPNLSWLPFRIKSMFGHSSSDMMPPSHCRFWTKSAVNKFLNNQYYQIVSWGGVIVLPKKYFGKFSRIRIKRVNIFSHDIVGVCKIINKE
jgi:2-polyprenyl-3-methyl-5-hydroxy-6-metoxy-1,4-benzoquinol methylase